VQSPGVKQRRRVVPWIVGVASAVAVLALVAGAALMWSAPRDAVALPGPDATPEQVVVAYIDALNARDFDTSNAIDSRPDSDLGRFGRPENMNDVKLRPTTTDGARAWVHFTADFSGGDGSMDRGRQSWGFILERGSDDRWHIVDAGVS
jgi:hypothetical protein